MRLAHTWGIVAAILGAGPTLTPSFSVAGENASAIAHAVWQIGTSAGLDSTNVTTGTPQLIITARGIKSFRGVDIGLRMIQCNGKPLVPAWQGNGTGGCNEGKWSFYVGGPGGYFPNVTTDGEPLPAMQLVRNQEYFGPSACGLATNKFGYLWLHVDAAAGVTRDPGKEYGLWAIKFDLRGTQLGAQASCTGDLSDPAGPAGLYFYACNLYPCGGLQRGGTIALIDRFGAVDYVPVNSPGVSWREDSECTGPSPELLCGGFSVPVEEHNWGKLRRIYR